jgi:hypothetical protein
MGAKWKGQRGSIIIWTVLALGMIGAFLALTVTVGRRQSVRGSLQNGVDSAALAGAGVLDATPERLPVAQITSVEFAARHVTDAGLAIVVAPDSDVVLGFWERATNVFTPIPGRTVTDAQRINAVEVLAGREASRGNAVPVAFGGAFLTQRTLDVRARAVAVSGGPCQVACALPFTIADCDLPTRCNTSLFLRASPAPTDLMAFTILSDSQATPPTVNDLLEEVISGHCATHEEGELVHVNNGNYFGPVEVNFERLIRMQPQEGYWVAITGAYTCPPQFVQDHPIVGFARVRLMGIVVQGSDKYIEILYTCDVHDPAPGGCLYYGTHARPRLVQ